MDPILLASILLLVGCALLFGGAIAMFADIRNAVLAGISMLAGWLFLEFGFMRIAGQITDLPGVLDVAKSIFSNLVSALTLIGIAITTFVGAYYASQQNSMIDWRGIRTGVTPGTGPGEGRSQPIWTLLLVILATGELLWGGVKLEKVMHFLKPNPVRALYTMAQKADKKAGATIYNAAMYPKFRITIPADDMESDDVEGLKTDLNAELGKLKDKVTATKILGIVITHVDGTTWEFMPIFETDKKNSKGKFIKQAYPVEQKIPDESLETLLNGITRAIDRKMNAAEPPTMQVGGAAGPAIKMPSMKKLITIP